MSIVSTSAPFDSMLKGDVAKGWKEVPRGRTTGVVPLCKTMGGAGPFSSALRLLSRLGLCLAPERLPVSH